VYDINFLYTIHLKLLLFQLKQS